MDNIIQLLPDHVANQIAAGEVVQRASSVVKELLENAIDAKADFIQLVVKDAGKTLIQVIDNGIGMSMVDAKMAFERHATSKIRNTQDIFNITTNGFRGEALASIAAVSQVELKTKRAEDSIGTFLQVEANEIKNQEPFVINQQGSSFSVKNLFYNVPARRSFLKSDQIEFRHIVDEFLRVAIPNPQIEFLLIHNNTTIFSLKKRSLKQRLVDIFGEKLNEQLVPVKEKTDIIEINGFICKPERAKKNKKEQFFFVNNRFIRSPYLNKAVYDAFENLIPSEFSPSYFLFITIPAHKIDVNIHPTKTEIKFEDEFAIFAILKAAVRHALGLFNVTPSLDFEQNPDLAFISLNINKSPISSPNIRVNPNYNPFKPDNFNGNSVSPKVHTQWITENYKDEKTEIIFEKEKIENQNFTAFQFQQAYIVVEQNQQIFVIDQHRAHQKVLYEKFIQSINQHSISSEQLLFPIEVELLKSEIEQFSMVEDLLHQLGFDISLAQNKIQINAIPSNITKENVEKLFHELLAVENKTFLAQDLVKLLSKSTAIKKGKKLSNEEITQLLQDLFSLDEYNYSPFGKPIYLNLSLEKIQKSFN